MESTDVLLPADILKTNENTASASGASKKACPWGNSMAETVSLADVMSEELANVLEKEDILRVTQKSIPIVQPTNQVLDVDLDASDDHVLAMLLQAEFDREHDSILRREEMKYNGKSKVSVSFDNYKRFQEHLLSDTDEESDLEEGEEKHWDSFERDQKSSPAIGRSGVARQADGVFKTKHDATVCGRRNACRVMELPPGISTGDGGGFDMRLSNHVYNLLKVHSLQESRRASRLHDKREKATAEQSLDPLTRLLLYKLVNREILDEVNGCISSGKESCVFHAAGGKSEEFVVPRECVVKVFKTTLNEFKNREEYIKGDFRFRDRFNKLNPRKCIHLWAEKEMHNLQKMRRAGIPCPEVVILKKHLLVMSFVGLDGIPAPKLKEARLNREQLASAYAQTVSLTRAMFEKCHLVHADLSEYNLLWHQGQVVVIDVSQAVDRMHPHALEFLLRDCTNVCQFFQRQGLEDVMRPQILFTEVCGLNLPAEGAELLSQIQNFERDRELLTHENRNGSDLFDMLLVKSMNKECKIGTEKEQSALSEPEGEEDRAVGDTDTN